MGWEGREEGERRRSVTCREEEANVRSFGRLVNSSIPRLAEMRRIRERDAASIRLNCNAMVYDVRLVAF